MRYLLLLVAVALLFFSCASALDNTAHGIGYSMHEPLARLVLPPSLQEISGITQIKGDTFACIQDENGIIFLINAESGEIIKEIRFTGDGDYEGIARVDSTIFILQSDGVLFEIPDFLSEESGFIAHTTGIPAQNNEGLCYDPVAQRLLIACKSNIGKGPEIRNIRAIYAFDLQSKKLSDKPVYEISIPALQQFAIDHRLNIREKETKKGISKGPDIKFRTSAIAVHPVNGRIYMLSAVDHMLCVLERDGSIHDLLVLDAETFNKPEGISFNDMHDMIITNEGQDKHPTLMLFRYAKEKR